MGWGIITSENSTIIKIMTKKDKDYNTLSDKYVKLGEKHKTLMEVHAKTIRNEYNLTDKLKEQRLEIVEDLNNFNWKYEIEDAGVSDWIKMIEKWEGKK